MGEIRDAKRHIHQAIQDTTEGAGLLDGAFLVRWVCVAEFAMPDGQNSLVQLTNRADGSDMHSWDREGLLFHSLLRGAPTARRDVEEDPDS